MTEYDTTPGIPIPPPITEEPAPPAEEPARPAEWSDVFRSVDELAAEVTRWARTMAEDPQNRRRVKELQDRIEGIGRQIGDTVESTSRSEFVREVGSAAAAAGDAAFDTARRVSDQVLPKVAGAIRNVADNIREDRESRERVRNAAPGPAADTPAPPVSHTPPEPVAPNRGEEPPAPAPSGTPHDAT